MSQHPAGAPSPSTGPSVPAATETSYTLERTAEITSVPRRTILLYSRHRLIRSVREGSPHFDDDALQRLRRIEDLRRQYRVNLAGLKLILGLLEEVEQLRTEVRFRRR